MANADILPDDWPDAVLAGRIWVGGALPGPRVVAVRDNKLLDLSEIAPTMSDLCDLEDPAAVIRDHRGTPLCTLDEAIEAGTLLAPCDLQAIKAAGVTFADSLIERVIEERANGDAEIARNIRQRLTAMFGESLSGIVPGSTEAVEIKAMMQREGLWSQYMEVGIGPDPEIFTKAQPLSAVGYGAKIGVHPDSRWNNPEPEIVVAVSSRGGIVGATLGNDVTLRDFEGRSALLLGKAKDNEASCAIGPFIRMFDQRFAMGDVMTAAVDLRVSGIEGFYVSGTNSMERISRAPETLVAATINAHHHYPDGLMLFLGTMYVPTDDRDGDGSGFSHRAGDRVRISSPRLGTLENIVAATDQAPPWVFGSRALMKSLSARGLL